VEQLLVLITEKLTTLADDLDTLRPKRKAITALFPFAARQERDKQYPILDVFVKTSRACKLLWHHIGPFLETQLNGAGDFSLKRAIMLVSPYMPWGSLLFSGDLAQAWAATASTIPKEEEIAPSIVDTLFQIAYRDLLQSHKHGNVWSWLTLRPPLPPICGARFMGSHPNVVSMVRSLKDIEILKSYLFLIWSEWGSLRDEGFDNICDSIRDDFGRIEMCSDCADLVERLDQVLGQLNRGLEYLRQDTPWLDEYGFQKRKRQYGELKAILLEEDRKNVGGGQESVGGGQESVGGPYPYVFQIHPPFDLLIPAGVRRVPLDIHVRTPSPVSVVDHP